MTSARVTILSLCALLAGCVRGGFSGASDGSALDRARADQRCQSLPEPALGSCPGVCESGDCDALPDSRDPWPSVCNPIVFGESFAGPASRFITTYCDPAIVGASCGELVFNNDPLLTLRAAVLSSVGLSVSSQMLVETRIHLVVPPMQIRLLVPVKPPAESCFPGDWDPFNNRGCLISFANGQRHLQSWAAAATTVGDVEILEPLGTDFVVQSLVADGKSVCRLELPNGHRIEAATPVPSDPGPGTSVVIEVVSPLDASSQVGFDWLRIFGPAS